VISSDRETCWRGSLPRNLTFLAAVLLALAAAACTGDLGLSEYKFACESDSDCPAGQRCDRKAGCVREAIDGGVGSDQAAVPGDRGNADTFDPFDRSEPSDRSDPSDRPDPADAGHDGGPDGGRDAGLMLRFSSFGDTTAGVSRSEGYTLKSVTGWTAGFRWSAGGYTLQTGNPMRAR
jgi:hypothetical protein